VAGATPKDEEAAMTGSTGTRTVLADEVFRDVIGRFASGVTVITTTAGDRDHGTTASAVSSLSMDPPMLLICLNKTSDTQAAILESGVFGVNILAEDQGQVAYQFAKKGQDKFAGVGIQRGRTGIPLVENALAHLECEVDETVTGGTHTVFLGRVKEATGKEGAPLTYFRGRFGRLESALDEAAYRDLRKRVIERTLPAGQPLDPERLATELDVDVQRIYYALTKLATDDLVSRRPEGYVVNPLTAEAAEQLFDARCTVEIGVVDQTVGAVGGESLDSLAQLADDLAQIVRSEAPDLTAFLDTSHAFHRQLVSLAGCSQLSETYERLGIPAFWTRTMAERTWWEDFDVVHHAQLVKAYRTGDLVEAKRLIYQHRDQVKGLVRVLITEAGGEV
jgi:4-nitrophenol 2-monooxygenase / 4-nitrocatechol 4-monooxygenase, reductase component